MGPIEFMNKKFTCIIAEDQNIHKILLIDLSTKLGLTVVDCVQSGSGLIESAQKHNPDIIITDIGLERLDGLSACRTIMDKGLHAKIIIISGSSEPKHYNLSYDLDSVDYLIKPITLERFERAVTKARKRIIQQQLLDEMQQTNQNMVVVKHKYRDMHINENEILFIEKLEKRLFVIYMTNGLALETSTNLLQLKQQVSNKIFYPHRSFLANVIHIKAVIPDQEIEGNYEIIFPQAQRKIPLTRRNFADYIMAKSLHEG
jgi:DNA-binding LytR/AlgR family response regulator